MTLLSPDQPRRSRRGVWLALGLLVALAGVGLTLRFMTRPPRVAAKPSPATRRPAPPLSTPTPPPPAAARQPALPPSPSARKAPLRVEADVPDASVFVDRRFVGKAPVDVRDVEPGPHRLNVSAEGHEMYAQEIEIGKEPQTVSVRFTEVRLDESLTVVHKHGIGSCRGILTADPAGLRFEARGGKDSFHAPLADLDRFEVDYLEKTLRVAIRGGRGYNFTLEGPSADPLLVFHKKVDQARKRLAP